MNKLIELDLEFDFSDALKAEQFDNDELHGGSTMKRVDFIAEYSDKYRFIEVKDPDQPGAKNPQAFLEKFKSDNLITSLAGKYRDSLLFRALSSKNDKAIEYIVLLSMEALEPALLINKQDQLHKAIPIEHHEWKSKSATQCIVLNLTQYKKIFGANSVRRISEGAV